jgi:F-type H+-transporting ATPase subunit b
MGKYLLLFSLLLPTLVFASSGGGSGETDIVVRTINFVIFAALLYYLIAEKAKNFFKQRKLDIASDLERVQIKLKESKKQREEAERKVEEARKIAEDIIATSKKEAYIIAQKAEEQCKIDMEILVKQSNENMEFQKRKAEKQVVGEILKELFESDVLELDEKSYTDIISRKVA